MLIDITNNDICVLIIGLRRQANYFGVINFANWILKFIWIQQRYKFGNILIKTKLMLKSYDSKKLVDKLWINGF